MRFLRAVVLCYCLVSLLAGCSSAPVADDVQQREANQIVAVLGKHKIQAHLVKARSGRGKYSVLVEERDFPRAAEVLTRLGLPAEKKPSFQDLTGSNGIIPPSREVEALRLDRAVASELEELLRARSDVATASVLLRMHSREGNERPTVTVVIQRSGPAGLDISAVREIARRAVSGIQNEDVYVSVAEPADQSEYVESSATGLVPFLGVWRVSAADHDGLVALVVLLVSFTGVLAGFAGYILGQFNWLNRQGFGAPSKSSRSGLRSGGSAHQAAPFPQPQQSPQDGGDSGGAA
jgi:type III secretory pathway lipoprotein EscJ